MKKLIATIIALTLALVPAAFAASALDATNAARAYAPADATYLYTEKDEGVYEVHFMNDTTGEEFEIDVDINTGKVLKFASDVKLATGSASITLADDAAFEVVKAEFPTAVLTGVMRITDDGLFEVRVYFTTDEYYGVYELNAETGAVIERDLYVGSPAQGWETYFDDDDDDDETPVQFSQPAATTKPQQPAATSKPQQPAATTKPSPKSDSSKDDLISVSKAKSVITSKYSGAKIIEISLDKDDGRYVYEGEARYNGAEYDFEINAKTGKLIEWERDD